MRKLYGLVVCGGESSRMGMDKSLLVYHDKPQRYYLYELLRTLCDSVFISCNKKQSTTISENYEKIVDLDRYENIGPMAALLSAFDKYPDADFLVLACDYPFIKKEHLQELLNARDKKHLAVSFFNTETNFKEPLLAFYSNECYPRLIHQVNRKEYSLKHFLKEIEAKKIIPTSPETIISIDTPEAYQTVLETLALQSTII